MKSSRSKSTLFGHENGTSLQRTVSAPLPDRIIPEHVVKPSDNPWLTVEQSLMSAPAEPPTVITWPKESAQVDLDMVMSLVSVLKRCGKEPFSLRKAISFTHVARLLRQVEATLQSEPNIIPVIPSSDKVKLAVLGDTHGQFYDVIKVFDLNGYPSDDNWYLFNGDFVDRGSWGIELALTLFAFKILFPHSVHLIRGNHETLYCTKTYGFLEECRCKYSKAVYQKFHSAFAKLPLASVILPLGSDPGPIVNAAHSEDPKIASGLGILVMHGGLYRNVDGSYGTIRLLQKSKRVVKDPQNEVVIDTLWSDPQLKPGLAENEQRGCAVLFGPDITEEFLRLHGLSLLIRSHEGPDAREKRPEMPNNMMSGYAIDQTYPNSDQPLCISIFSAPDYPMGPKSRRNRAAFITFAEESLRSLEPKFTQFDAGDRPIVPLYIEDDTGDLTDMES